MGGIMQFNKNATERAKEDIKAALKTLNDHLLTRTFLVGERLSVADIAVACTLLSLYKQVLDPAFRKPFMNVTRWFTTVSTSRTQRTSSVPFPSLARWQNSMRRSSPSSPVRVETIKRRKRRRKPLSRKRNQKRRTKRRKRRRKLRFLTSLLS